MLVRQGPGDVGQQPVAIQGFDLDRHQERAVGGRRPGDADDPLGVLGPQVGGVDAVVAVHRHSRSPGDEAEDRVTRHRRAALGELDQQVGVPGHLDTGVRRRRLPPPTTGDDLVLVDLVGGGVLAALHADQPVDHGLRTDGALAHGGVQGRHVRQLEVVGDRGQVLEGEQPLQRQTGLAHLPGDRLLAGLDRLLAATLGEVVADLVAGPRALHELEPVAVRSGVLGLGGQDLDHVAVGQLGLQRHQPPVHPGADGTVTDLGVDGVREVDRCRTLGQGVHVTLGGEGVDLGGVDLEPQRVEELPRVRGLPLPVEQLPHPGEVRTVTVGGGRDALAALLVLPVRRDTELGPLVHLVGADLQLHRAALRPQHRGVQGLVHVELRHRDVVLEPARERVPADVHHPEGRIAVPGGVDQDAQADEVEDVGEVAATDDHLLVDRVVVLRPSGDGGADLGGPQVRGHLLDHLGEELVPAGSGLGDHPDDLVVDLRLHGREGQVLELPLDRVHAQAVGQRGEDVQRLGRDPVLLVGPQVVQRAHVVQPVGQLDHQHPDVSRHRDDHLADGLRLGRLAVLDLVELRTAVDQEGDLLTEVTGQRGQRVRGVLDGVVQQGGAQRRLGQAELGQDRGHGQRVRDVGVTAAPGLTTVVALGGPVGPLDQGQVGLGMAGADHLEQRVQHRCLRLGGAEPGDPLPHPHPRLLRPGAQSHREAGGPFGIPDHGSGRRRGAGRRPGAECFRTGGVVPGQDGVLRCRRSGAHQPRPPSRTTDASPCQDQSSPSATSSAEIASLGQGSEGPHQSSRRLGRRRTGWVGRSPSALSASACRTTTTWSPVSSFATVGS